MNNLFLLLLFRNGGRSGGFAEVKNFKIVPIYICSKTIRFKTPKRIRKSPDLFENYIHEDRLFDTFAA